MVTVRFHLEWFVLLTQLYWRKLAKKFPRVWPTANMRLWQYRLTMRRIHKRGSRKHGWFSLSADKAANNRVWGESYCVSGHMDHFKCINKCMYVDSLTLLSLIFKFHQRGETCMLFLRGGWRKNWLCQAASLGLQSWEWLDYFAQVWHKAFLTFLGFPETIGFCHERGECLNKDANENPTKTTGRCNNM